MQTLLPDDAASLAARMYEHEVGKCPDDELDTAVATQASWFRRTDGKEHAIFHVAMFNGAEALLGGHPDAAEAIRFFCDAPLLRTIRRILRAGESGPTAAAEVAALCRVAGDRVRAEAVATAWREVGFVNVCPLVLGAIVAIAHKSGDLFSELSCYFDEWEIELMFVVSHRDGFAYGMEPLPPFTTDRLRVYRGDFGDPRKVAGGMSWTLDVWKARRYAQAYWHLYGRRVAPTVVEAEVPAADVLATFAVDKEVVLPIDPDRRFRLVDPWRSGDAVKLVVDNDG